MDMLETFEFCSEDFSSVYLLQKLLNRNRHFLNLKENLSIQLKPRLFVLRHPESSDKVSSLNFGTRKETKCREHWTVCDLPLIKDGPFAVVVLLNPDGTHGHCRLSTNDMKLLEKLPDIILKSIEKVTFAVKGNRHHKSYDSKDLESLSFELYQKLLAITNGDQKFENAFPADKRNSFFPNIFLVDEEGLCIRLGICMMVNLIEQVKEVRNAYNKVIGELDLVIKRKSIHNCIKKSVVSTMSVASAISIQANKISKAFNNELMRSGYLEIKTLNENTKFCRESFLSVITSVNLLQPHREKIGHKGRKYRRSRLSEVLRQRQKPYTRSKVNVISNMNFKCIIVLINNAIEEKLMDINHRLKELVSLMLDEQNSTAEMFLLHQLKTTALRHEKVKGFGSTEDQVKIYLKRNQETDKKDVLSYLESFFDLKRKFKITVEFKERSFMLFSKLEQGSKINKYSRPEESPTKEIKFGSVGMFLHDDKQTYFFTTCAHVIGQNAFAYSAHDNTIVGQNVLVLDSESETSISPFLDFSLVQISPEKSINCYFGLKSITGVFQDFQIFRGDLTEVKKKCLYIWGATADIKQTGRCIECTEDEGYLSLRVNTSNFAQPGDSGAIVCVGDQVDNCMAAFILVGGNSNDEYLVFRVSDAIDKITDKRSEVKPYTCPHVKAFGIGN